MRASNSKRIAGDSGTLAGRAGRAAGAAAAAAVCDSLWRPHEINGACEGESASLPFARESVLWVRLAAAITDPLRDNGLLTGGHESADRFRSAFSDAAAAAAARLSSMAGRDATDPHPRVSESGRASTSGTETLSHEHATTSAPSEGEATSEARGHRAGWKLAPLSAAGGPLGPADMHKGTLDMLLSVPAHPTSYHTHLLSLHLLTIRRRCTSTARCVLASLHSMCALYLEMKPAPSLVQSARPSDTTGGAWGTRGYS